MTNENTSGTNINELATALAKAQGEFIPASKNSTNPFHKNKYADLASVVDSAREILTKHGLSVAQLPKHIPELGWVLETMLLHSSGQSISCQLPLILDKNTNQSMGASMTYMRRYGFCAITGVVVDEDDDGETADGRGKSRNQNATPTPTPPIKAPIVPIVQAPAPAPTPPMEPRVNQSQLNDITEGLKLIDKKTLDNYHIHMQNHWETKAGDYKNLPARAYDATMTAIKNNLNQQPQKMVG